MPIKSEPPLIGKIGPYTVFVMPMATPKPESSTKTVPVQGPVRQRAPPPVMAPPVQFYKEKPSLFAFFLDVVAKVQNAHANLDEHVAHWFGLNQSKYQWALDDYYEDNEKNQKEAKPQVKKQCLRVPPTYVNTTLVKVDTIFQTTKFHSSTHFLSISMVRKPQ